MTLSDREIIRICVRNPLNQYNEYQAKVDAFVRCALTAMGAPEHLNLDQAIEAARKQATGLMDSAEMAEAERHLRGPHEFDCPLANAFNPEPDDRCSCLPRD
jgi:uncharacterized protein YfiM (DUF2279 family)